MFPKNKRIPRKLFPLFLKGAKVFKNKLFLFRMVVNKGEAKNSRFCFSISKKIAKKAVVRNRLRRSGYRILKDYLLKIELGVIVNFSFKYVPKDNEEILHYLTDILIESKLLK